MVTEYMRTISSHKDLIRQTEADRQKDERQQQSSPNQMSVRYHDRISKNGIEVLLFGPAQPSLHHDPEVGRKDLNALAHDTEHEPDYLKLILESKSPSNVQARRDGDDCNGKAYPTY